MASNTVHARGGSYHYRHPHPAVCTDVVVFTIHDGSLDVLLVRRRKEPFRGCWALPGGFIEINGDLEDSALRELKEETGVSGVYLEQLYTFGCPTRDPRERVISVVYYALTPSDHLRLRAGSDAAAVDWFRYVQLPDLAFDHLEMIRMAKQRLAAKLGYSTIAFQVMPRKFTLSALQHVYERILDKPLDKRNFRKRVLSYGCLSDTGEALNNGKHRPARLYELKSPGTVEFFK